MQRIQSWNKNKKTPESGRLLICNNCIVREMDYRWNQVYASLMLMYEKLARFGLSEYDL